MLCILGTRPAVSSRRSSWPVGSMLLRGVGLLLVVTAICVNCVARSSVVRVSDPGHASFENAIGLRMVYIQPGEYTMGIPDRNNEVGVPSDSPPHRVELPSGFYVGETEVTQEQFQKVMGYNPS